MRIAQYFKTIRHRSTWSGARNSGKCPIVYTNERRYKGIFLWPVMQLYIPLISVGLKCAWRVTRLQHKGEFLGEKQCTGSAATARGTIYGRFYYLNMLFPMFHSNSLAGIPQHRKLEEGELQNHIVVGIEFYCFAIRARHLLTQLMRHIFFKN